MKLPSPISSMSRKLVLMFLCTTVVTHLVVGHFAQKVIERHFFELAEEHLERRHYILSDQSTLNYKDPETLKQFERTRTAIWVLQGDKTVYQNSEVALSDTPANFSLMYPEQTYSRQWKDNEGYYIASSFYLGENTTLVLGLDIDQRLEFFDAVSNMMFWFTLVISILAAIYSTIIVQRGLRPLKRLEKYLSKIRPGKLDIRIPTQRLPTELKQLSVAQNNMLDRMELGFQRLSDFSSDIAHELRTPVTNMTTQIQVVLAHSRTEEEYRDTLGSNLEELERITKTINDTLYLAKAENELLDQDKTLLNLGKEMEPLIEYYEIMAEDKDVAIKLHGNGELYGDKHMFQRAINNLLSNAIRHAQKNSTIHINIKNTSDQLSISICNYGDTITKDSLPYIFDRFYRADSSRVIDFGQGAGLGLAITKSIIETHQGTIEARSKDGQTTFEILFPNT